MNDKIECKESFYKVKIFKPKPVRLCPPRRKQINSTITNSKMNPEKKSHKHKGKPKKKLVNLDEISIEEINKDFKKYRENMDEEYCHNELLYIINNANVNINENKKQNIKRCKAPKNITSENMKDSYFSTFINEFNNLLLSQPENDK